MQVYIDTDNAREHDEVTIQITCSSLELSKLNANDKLKNLFTWIDHFVDTTTIGCPKKV